MTSFTDSGSVLWMNVFKKWPILAGRQRAAGGAFKSATSPSALAGCPPLFQHVGCAAPKGSLFHLCDSYRSTNTTAYVFVSHFFTHISALFYFNPPSDVLVFHLIYSKEDLQPPSVIFGLQWFPICCSNAFYHDQTHKSAHQAVYTAQWFAVILCPELRCVSV